VGVGVGGSATGGAVSGVGGSSAGGSGGTGSGGTGTGGSTTGDPTRQEIFHASFTAAQVGAYAEADVAADFGSAPPWNDGLNQGRASIVDEAGEKFLRVNYPAGQYGPSKGGVQFIVDLGGSYDELFFSYRVRFAAGFDFVQGGKLPGLVGGTNPSGCSPKKDGFSARNMWRTGGNAVQYVYWPNQPKTCGDNLDYKSSGSNLPFTPGIWHTVEHRIVMNTPGTADGVLQAWFDGELVLDDSARLWRLTGATFGIDSLSFSTFFGGGDASWAPAAAQVADFDDLIVADKAISH